MKGQAKKLKRLQIQNERLSFFNQEEDHYEEKKVDGGWFIKMWNGGTQRWQVSMFTDVAYKKYKAFGNAKQEEEEMDNQFKEKVFDETFVRPTLESVKNMLK